MPKKVNSSVIIKRPELQYQDIGCTGILFSENSGPELSFQKLVQ